MVVFNANHSYVPGFDLKDQSPLPIEANRVLMLALALEPFSSKAASGQISGVFRSPYRLHGFSEAANNVSTEPGGEFRIAFKPSQVLVGECHSQLDYPYIPRQPLSRNDTFTASVKIVGRDDGRYQAETCRHGRYKERGVVI